MSRRVAAPLATSLIVCGCNGSSEFGEVFLLFRSAMTDRTEREPEVEPEADQDRRNEQERREGKKTKMPREDEEVRSPSPSPRWEVRISEWRKRLYEERKKKLEEDYWMNKRIERYRWWCWRRREGKKWEAHQGKDREGSADPADHRSDGWWRNRREWPADDGDDDWQCDRRRGHADYWGEDWWCDHRWNEGGPHSYWEDDRECQRLERMWGYGYNAETD